jgi:hypothetical protein
MLLNVRLQIVALLVSVVALSFGFGVFAAFRVNHEPLAQIPAAATPLQLTAQNTAPPNTPTTWGAPFGSRFWLSETQIHGVADLPPLTPVVRHDVIERTVTWVVVTGSAAGVPVVQGTPAALPNVQAVDAPLAPKQSGANEEAPALGDNAASGTAPATVVGATEPAAQSQPEVTNSLSEQATQEPMPPKVPVSAPHRAARAALLRRHVAAKEPLRTLVRPQARAQFPGPNAKAEEPVVFESAPKAPVRTPVKPQARSQSAGQREAPVVFQSAPSAYRPQKGTPVAVRSGSQNSASDVPVFLSAPPSQR